MTADLARVCVIGTPGVGKSWVAQRLARASGSDYIELDALKLRPHDLAPAEEFRAEVLKRSRGESWVIDGNWEEGELLDDVWSRVTTIVWVDYPRWRVMLQVIPRSFARVLSGEILYGRRDRFRDWLQPTHPIRWSWKMHRPYRERYERFLAARPALPRMRLRSREQASAFLNTLEQQ